MYLPTCLPMFNAIGIAETYNLKVITAIAYDENQFISFVQKNEWESKS